jgi:TP901 family phage tail tape measure protein
MATAVTFDLRGNAKSFNNSIKSGIGGVKRFVGSLKGLAKTIAALRTDMLGMVGIFKSFEKLKGAVVAFASLEEALLKIKAVTGSTDDEMKLLREQIEKLGFTTQFTTEDIAAAFFNLGTLGIKGAKAFKELTPSIVDAAVALDVDLNRAAELVLSTIKVFNLENKDAAKVVDMLTNAYTNSSLNAEKFAIAQQFAGLAAKTFKRGLEDILPLLMALTDQGVDASIAGTQIRTAFLKLLKPTKAAQEALKRVGLTVEDVNVESNGFIGVLEKMEKANISNADAVEIFGVRAMPVINALLQFQKEGKKGTEILRDFERIVLKSGEGARQAAQRQKGLSFALKQAAASAGIFAVSAGDALNRLFGLEAITTRMAQRVAWLANVLKTIDFDVLKQAGIRIFDPAAISQNLKVAFDQVIPAVGNLAKEAFGLGAVFFGQKLAENMPTIVEFSLNLFSRGFIRLVGAGARLFVEIFAGGLKFAVTGLASFFNQIIASMLIAFGNMLKNIPGLSEEGKGIVQEGVFRRKITRKQFEQDPRIGALLDVTNMVRDEATGLIKAMEDTAIEAVQKSTRAIKDATKPAFEELARYFEAQRAQFDVGGAVAAVREAAGNVPTEGQRQAAQTVIDNRNQVNHNYRNPNRNKMIADKEKTTSPKGDRV